MLGFTAASPSSIPTIAIFRTPKVAAMGVKVHRHPAASPSYFSTKAATFVPAFPCAVVNCYSLRSNCSRIEANYGALTESSPDTELFQPEKQHLLWKVMGYVQLKWTSFTSLIFPNMILGAHLNLDAMMDDGNLIALQAVLPDVARRKEALDKLKIGSIELVVANLAKFRSGAAALKGMDIRGVAIIATAAEADKDVLVVVDPSDYPVVLELLRGKRDDQQFRRKLAVKALDHLCGHLGISE